MGKTRKCSKADITRFGRLIGLYAQSRSFGLTALIGLSVAVFGLHFGATHVCIRLCASAGAPGWLITVLMIALMIPTVAFWMWGVGKVVRRVQQRFYGRDGEVVLQRENVPVWAWVAYGVTFLGPAGLSIANRWALTISLTSFGLFMIYAGKKEKEIVLGIVFGGLCLLEAAATALGMPLPFSGPHAWVMSLMAYIIGAGVSTGVLVHVFNRAILRRIKGASSFGQRSENSADPEH